MLTLMMPVTDAKPAVELKVIATGLWRARCAAASATVRPQGRRRTRRRDGPGRDDAGRKEALEAMAKLFQVDAIDFTKQMIVVVTAGPKPTGIRRHDRACATARRRR
jgi:hypothetical protein